MADPPKKPVYSIFHPRPKLSSKPASSAEPAAAPQAPLTSTSTSSAADAAAFTTLPAKTKEEKTAPLRSASSKASEGKATSRAATPAESITIDDDDHCLSDSSATLVASSNGEQKRKGAQNKGKGKGKTKVVDSSEDSDDDLIIIEGLKKAKGKKPKRGKKGADEPKKGKKAKKADKGPASVDLTLSPPRPTAHSRPSLSTASTSFAPLSEVYRADRERRKAHEPVEARWPTAEEHGGAEQGKAKRELAYPLDVPRHRNTAIFVEGGKGKGKEVDGDDFLAAFEKTLDFASTRTTPRSSFANPPQLKHIPLSDVSSLLPSFPCHPLLDRLAAPFRASPPKRSAFSRPGEDARSPSDKLWTMKYAPQNASEVLGKISGENAKCLREWLKELRVAGGAEDNKKRRRLIKRGVTKAKKKRRADGLDDFIADSDEEDDEVAYDSASSPPRFPDDVDFASLASSTSNRSIFPSLTNLILLHGPHGSGKTASVYAVAQELGYEIFEVNAGMGRRGAKDVEREVGDVGRNHIVRASPKKGGTKNLFAMFAKKGAGKAEEKEKKGEAEEEDEDEGDKPAIKGPTQSLILFEEVDVLYNEERDFWAGLKQLAEQSRRPIVLTCTDTSLIPTDDLGLQKISFPSSSVIASSLDFAPPEPALAIPFLQLVALSEGHLLTASSLTHLFTQDSRSSPNPPWLLNANPARPLPHPYSNAPLVSVDLRKAMMQLQWECQWGLGDPTGGVGWLDLGDEKVKEGRTSWSVGTLERNEEPKKEESKQEGKEKPAKMDDDESGKNEAEREVEELKKAWIAADSLSFADAYVSRRIEMLLEELDTGFFTTPSDEEVGFPLLDRLPSQRAQLPFLGREPEMVDAIEELAYSIWPAAGRFTEEQDEELEERRATYVFHLAQLTSQLSPDPFLAPYPAPLLPRPALVTDYLPALRAIARADDLHEAAAEGAGEGGATTRVGAGGGGARKRRSTRLGGQRYERRLEWDAGEKVWLEGSGFDGVEPLGS
ncbi:hypothetical protein JCM5296_007173 [Sporobolomyces johnsonii]